MALEVVEKGKRDFFILSAIPESYDELFNKYENLKTNFNDEQQKQNKNVKNNRGEPRTEEERKSLERYQP